MANGRTLNRSRILGTPTQDESFFDFTDGDPWRVLRIQAELVEGFDTLAHLGPAVTIFGSARTKPDTPEYSAAREVARRLGERGLAIITGGGPGIMQAANQGAMDVGARSVGLNIELPFEQRRNPYVELAVDFRYFMVRKTMLVKYARAFVIFPGGFGTLDELFEALTLIQTGKIHDFPLVLFGSDYWGGLIDWISNQALSTGKISSSDVELLTVTDDPAEAARLAAGESGSDRKDVESRSTADLSEVYSNDPASGGPRSA